MMRGLKTVALEPVVALASSTCRRMITTCNTASLTQFEVWQSAPAQLWLECLSKPQQLEHDWARTIGRTFSDAAEALVVDATTAGRA